MYDIASDMCTNIIIIISCTKVHQCASIVQRFSGWLSIDDPYQTAHAP